MSGSSWLREVLGRGLAAFSHLPNGTPCTSCFGSGRVDTAEATWASIGRWVRGEPDVEGETEPCGRCGGTGARHCDYGCKRISVAFDLDVDRFVCAECVTSGGVR